MIQKIKSMSEEITKREFSLRPKDEKEWLIQNTWCDFCGKADLGMEKPIEYEKNGKYYLSGLCSICGQKVISEIIEE